MLVHYSEINSGGHAWLKEEHRKALHVAGWEVFTRHRNSLVTAFKDFPDGLAVDPLTLARADWMGITGLNVWEEGCPCCGAPHEFYEDQDGSKRSLFRECADMPADERKIWQDLNRYVPN